MPTISIRNISIHYREQGTPDRPVLLLIHGLGCSLKYWACLFAAQELSPYRIIALDLPGFGLSEKPDAFDYRFESQAELIFDLLDALRIEKCSLIGHSMGGAIAIIMALQRPERLRQLIAIEPNLRAGDAQLSRKIVEYADEADFIRQYDAFRASAIAAVKSWFVAFQQADLDENIGELLKTTPVSMYRSARSLISVTSDPEFIRRFQRLPIDTHFLIGAETLKNRPLLRELLSKEVTSTIVPGVGHMMMVDDPAVFTATLAALLI